MKSKTDILRALVETIDSTGGICYNWERLPAPVFDEDWLDMGLVYIDACIAIGVQPRIHHANRLPRGCVVHD